MNAVNLIPVERRYTGVAAPGIPFLAALAALLLALAGTVVYVGARNVVSTRQSELSQMQAGVAGWSAAEARYAPAITALSQRDRQFTQLGGLLGERYDWSVLLGQLAGVMPAHAELTSMSAATPSTAAGSSAASGATAAPTAQTGAVAGSGVTIEGCAASQSVVADTMIALRRLSGVSAVALSSSALQGASGSGGASTGGAGNCTLPVDFSLTLQFSPSARSVTVPGGANVTPQGDTATTTTTSPNASETSTTGVAQ